MPEISPKGKRDEKSSFFAFGLTESNSNKCTMRWTKQENMLELSREQKDFVALQSIIFQDHC